METTTEKAYYSVRGILFTILPYYGKYREWGRIVSPICKAANEIWKSQQEEFLNLNRQTRWREPDGKALSEVYMETIGREIEFDNNLMLYIDIYDEDELKFIQQASKLAFMDYKKLCIENIWNDKVTINAINDFLSFSYPDKLDEISLLGDSESVLKINVLEKGLARTLPSVTSVVDISSLSIPSSTFKCILQNANNGEIISLTDGEIEINEDITFESSIDYKFIELILYGSAFKIKETGINKETLHILAREMGKTNMISTLKTIKTKDHQFPRREIIEAFNNEGFVIT